MPPGAAPRARRRQAQADDCRTRSARSGSVRSSIEAAARVARLEHRQVLARSARRIDMPRALLLEPDERGVVAPAHRLAQVAGLVARAASSARSRARRAQRRRREGEARCAATAPRSSGPGTPRARQRRNAGRPGEQRRGPASGPRSAAQPRPQSFDPLADPRLEPSRRRANAPRWNSLCDRTDASTARASARRGRRSGLDTIDSCERIASSRRCNARTRCRPRFLVLCRLPQREVQPVGGNVDGAVRGPDAPAGRNAERLGRGLRGSGRGADRRHGRARARRRTRPVRSRLPARRTPAAPQSDCRRQPHAATMAQR